MRNVEGIMHQVRIWIRSPSLLLSVRLVSTMVDIVLLVHKGLCCVVASADWGSSQVWFYHSSCREIWPCFLSTCLEDQSPLGPLPAPCSCHAGHWGTAEALLPQEGKGRPLCPWTITHLSALPPFLDLSWSLGAAADWKLSLPNLYVEDLIPDVMVFGGGSGRCFMVGWGHEGGAFMMRLVCL